MLYSRFRAFSFVDVKFMLKKWGKKEDLIFFSRWETTVIDVQLYTVNTFSSLMYCTVIGTVSRDFQIIFVLFKTFYLG